MAIERTLSIIKPNAVAQNVIGAIEQRFEQAGLKIIAMKMRHLTQSEAEGFYAEHRGKPFFDGLIAFMISGPLIVQVLEGEDAIRTNRELMGATDASKAAPGTLRADFGSHEQVTANAVHGSDAPLSAAREIRYFFTEDEVFSR